MIVPLRYQWGLLFLLMGALLPISPSLSLSGWDAPLVSFFFWPFAHANILHYLVNLWAWIWWWPLVTWDRLWSAYIVSILAGLAHITFTTHPLPLLGFSGIIFFFVGFSVPLRPLKSVLISVVFLALPLLFFDTIAGEVHMLTFCFGWAYCKSIQMYG
ncbi:MAG: hypothetical protein IKM71_01820 [Bacteroidaceae bacterium]|nr:hypothetical protein [Bacteroidaceae bacterium]